MAKPATVSAGHEDFLGVELLDVGSLDASTPDGKGFARRIKG